MNLFERHPDLHLPLRLCEPRSSFDPNWIRRLVIHGLFIFRLRSLISWAGAPDRSRLNRVFVCVLEKARGILVFTFFVQQIVDFIRAAPDRIFPNYNFLGMLQGTTACVTLRRCVRALAPPVVMSRKIHAFRFWPFASVQLAAAIEQT
jgi:hypothetical protein